jgi:deoxyribonuclease-4
MINKKNLLIGAHTSTAGGVYTAIERAMKMKFTAIQIFTKNNNRWHAKALEENEIIKFNELIIKSNIRFILSHSSYLINLCSNNRVVLKKSRNAFVDELKRCELLGIPHLNFHPGSHGGQGEKDGIKIIAESLNICHEKTKNCKVTSMLEATAGQGTTLGYRFEQLQKIIDLVEDKKRMTVCIDTAHIFAAGYNIRNQKEYKIVVKEFDYIIGLNRLKCLHMNDSKKELGSRVDRHEHIGKGFIGKEGFINIMNDKKLENTPKILETPKGKEMKEDLINIKTLRKLIKE